MIGVNLGKSGLDKKKVSPLGKIFRPTRKPTASLGSHFVGRFVADAKVVVVLLVASAIAFLPHLVLQEYKEWVHQKHADSVKELNDKIKTTEQEIAKFVPFQKELASYEAQKKIVSEKLRTVQNLLSSRSTPINIMDVISQSLPRGVWLTAARLAVTSSTGTLSVDAKAFTADDISDYVDKLSESVYLQGVKLKGVKEGRIEGDIKINDFSLEIVPKFSLGELETVETPTDANQGKAAAAKERGPAGK